MRWKLHAVVRCLEAWRKLTAEEVRKRALTGRVVLRMLNRSLCFAMALWRENARENKAMAVKSMRVVMRWKKQAAVRCLDAWRHRVERKVSEGRMMRMGDRMRRRHGRRVLLLPAFADWEDQTRAAKCLGYRAGKAEGGRRRKLLGSSMRQWTEEVDGARRLRR